MPDRPLTISTHVLDLAKGAPATGVRVFLYRLEGEREEVVGEGTTDGDGRVAELLRGPLVEGDYRLEFDVQAWSPLFTALELRFRVTDVGRSYHLPLLLAPFSMATYRGS